MMHWRVKAVRSVGSQIPYWRAILHDGERSYGELFTCYQLQGLRLIVQFHDRIYPIKVSCTWSPAVERNARAALQRSGLSLIDEPISL